MNFNEDDWLEELCKAGFDRKVPATVVWEGGVYYVTDAVVRGVLKEVATLTPGSVVGFDYFSAEMVQRGPLQALTKFMGEALLSDVPTLAPAEASAELFLGECGLELLWHQPFGRERPGKGPFGGFILGVVPGEREDV